MKKFCEFLRNHAMEIINFRKNEVINTGVAGIKMKMQKSVIFVKKNLRANM